MTADQMRYNVENECDEEKIRRLLLCAERTTKEVKMCVRNLDTLFAFFQNFIGPSADIPFVEHCEIPGLEFMWYGDKPRPYLFFERQIDITIDASRLGTLYTAVRECLEAGMLVPEKTWCRFLNWSTNFIGFSRLEVEDSYMGASDPA